MIYFKGPYNLVTRALVKQEIRQNGWHRNKLFNRPAADFATILVAHETLNKKYGTTEQWLTIQGEYDKQNDTLRIFSWTGGSIEEIPMQTFHWWKLINDITETNILNLHAANSMKSAW